ncbi:hypothetical protein N0V86_000359 [Didymella sp. IMI 355093]|nr:hypothetical protein N0V86_000359 [Didymella sp. IMI 355093]
MSASELEVQPARINEVGHAAVRPLPLRADRLQEPLTQDAPYEEPPLTKSNVHLSKELALQNARFKKGEWVHMSLIENGARVKGVYSIWALQYNRGGWVDYQLLDLHDQLYKHGAWTRESLLKGGK